MFKKTKEKVIKTENQITVIDENNNIVITETDATNEIKKGFDKAKIILFDEKKFEAFLLRLEEAVKTIPFVGDKLSHAVVFVSLLKSYFKKEYTDISSKSLITIISTLIYFISPIDLIPDIIKKIGKIDDIFILSTCFKIVGEDIDKYIKWREIKKQEEENERKRKIEEEKKIMQKKKFKKLLPYLIGGFVLIVIIIIVIICLF